MRITALLVFAAIVAMSGTARAEQIRLKTGEFLQGEILSEQTDENVLTIRLYRTGGVFQIDWSRLIREDEDRLREDLGLKPVDIEEMPQVEGHELVLVNGERVFGLVENPSDTTGPVSVRTATGRREYPRSMVMKVLPAMIDALEVYSPAELAGIYRQEAQPDTPAAHLDLGDRFMQITAYEDAKVEYEAALADPDFGASERAQVARNRLARAEILIRAKDATDRVQEIKRLAFRDKFDEALTEVDQLSADYAENPAILNLLNLDRLRRQVASDRRKHYRALVRRRFYPVMGNLVAKKVRDKEASITEVLQWAQNSRGLGHDIFAAIAEETGLTEAQVQDFWKERAAKQVHRYSYGGATFMNREISDQVRSALAQARAAQGRGNQSNRNNPRGGNNRNRPKQKAETPTTPEEWWKAASPSDKEKFVKAWFAEYAGVLEVLRFDRRVCSNCSGRGITITNDASSGEEVRHICRVCNLAGQERIVIAR